MPEAGVTASEPTILSLLADGRTDSALAVLPSLVLLLFFLECTYRRGSGLDTETFSSCCRGPQRKGKDWREEEAVRRTLRRENSQKLLIILRRRNSRRTRMDSRTLAWRMAFGSHLRLAVAGALAAVGTFSAATQKPRSERASSRCFLFQDLQGRRRGRSPVFIVAFV